MIINNFIPLAEEFSKFVYKTTHQMMKSRAVANMEEGSVNQGNEDKKVEDKVVPSRGYSDTSRNLKLLFCFAGLQVSYIAWGIVQEQLMTTEYKMGRFTSSSFCVFGNRFFALIVALIIVLYNRSKAVKPMKEAPYQYYFPASLSNSLSSWAQYEALKYVSFPAQVLSKSCKLIPVMLVGILVNKKSYPWIEYLEALAITFGVAMFTFADKAGSAGSDRVDSMYGTTLLCLYLCCDSFTSQWQSKVYKQYGVDQYQMMLGVNIWSMFLTGFTLLQSGEGLTALAFITADREALLHMFILSLTSATGQLFVYYTIKEFGPVVFTIMMTTRQIFSLVLSCLMFAHQLGAYGWIGAILVFGIVFNRLRRGSD